MVLLFATWQHWPKHRAGGGEPGDHGPSDGVQGEEGPLHGGHYQPVVMEHQGRAKHREAQLPGPHQPPRGQLQLVKTPSESGYHHL